LVDREYHVHAHRLNVRNIMRTVAFYEVKAPFLSQNAMHSVAWQATMKLASLPLSVLWERVFAEICPFGLASNSYYVDCLHGVGHGLLLSVVFRHSSIRPEDTNACMPLCWKSRGITLSQLRDALDACRQAPDVTSRMICSGGSYHHLFEAGMNPRSITSLSQAVSFCGNEEDLFTLWCFQLMFSNGAVGGFFSRRLLLGDYLQIDCFAYAMRSESNRLGCVAAISMNAYRTFHDTVASLVRDIMYSKRPPCVNSLMLTWGDTHDLTGVDILQSTAQNYALGSTPIIVQWCDRFAPFTQLHNLTYRKRFRCCVVSTGLFFSKKAFIELFDPRKARRHCDELLWRPAWTSDGFFLRKIHHDCLNATLISPQHPSLIAEACLI